MRPRYMVWTSHFLGLILMLFGLWWLIGHMAGISDYKLVVALAAMTGFVYNHFRWWSHCKKISDSDMLEKFNYLIVSNYVVLLLILVLVDYR